MMASEAKTTKTKKKTKRTTTKTTTVSTIEPETMTMTTQTITKTKTKKKTKTSKTRTTTFEAIEIPLPTPPSSPLIGLPKSILNRSSSILPPLKNKRTRIAELIHHHPAKDLDLHFYPSIPTFRDFTGITNCKNYTRVPKTWRVIISKVQQSIEYIDCGRYRDVNTVSASCIGVVGNALMEQFGTKDFAYVFSGDGASMVVPNCQLETALWALMGWQRLVKKNFGMELGVNSVPVSALEEDGVRVEVAKYEIVEGTCIAVFRGGGLRLAHRMAKEMEQENFLEEIPLEDVPSLAPSLEEDLSEEPIQQGKIVCPNVDGISSRWRKMPNRNGCVLTLLVMCNEHKRRASAVYSEILEELEKILDCSSSQETKPGWLGDANTDPLREANPVNTELAVSKSVEQMVADEAQLHERRWSTSFLKRWIDIHLCGASAYKWGLRSHAEYHKFDDMIRMVIDCSLTQANAVEAMFRERHEERNEIFYGTHRSECVLMTCLGDPASEDNQIHFVDGDNGGYAMASRQLNTQTENYSKESQKMPPESPKQQGSLSPINEQALAA